MASLDAFGLDDGQPRRPMGALPPPHPKMPACQSCRQGPSRGLFGYGGGPSRFLCDACLPAFYEAAREAEEGGEFAHAVRTANAQATIDALRAVVSPFEALFKDVDA